MSSGSTYVGYGAVVPAEAMYSSEEGSASSGTDGDSVTGGADVGVTVS